MVRGNRFSDPYRMDYDWNPCRSLGIKMLARKKNKLLVVDDNPDVRWVMQIVFERDFEVLEAAGEKEALRLYLSEFPEVVFLDIELSGMPAGWHVLKRIREIGKKTIVALITGNSSAERNPLSSQADGFFEKPFDLQAIRAFLAAQGVFLGKTSG